MSEELTGLIRVAIAGREDAARVWARPGSDFQLMDAGRALLAHALADREILDAHPTVVYAEERPGPYVICGTCRYDDGLEVYDVPCPTVAALARAYEVPIPPTVIALPDTPDESQ